MYIFVYFYIYICVCVCLLLIAHTLHALGLPHLSRVLCGQLLFTNSVASLCGMVELEKLYA